MVFAHGKKKKKKPNSQYIPTLFTQNTQPTIIYILGKTFERHLHLSLDNRTIGNFQELSAWKYSLITKNLQNLHCRCEEKKKKSALTVKSILLKRRLSYRDTEKINI